MTDPEFADLVQEATLDFTMGDNEVAIEKLMKALTYDTDHFDAYHALTEVYYAQEDFDRALEVAEKARALRPEDIQIHTSLSRIWLGKGNKDQAEHFGAQARMLGWKEQLKKPPEDA